MLIICHLLFFFCNQIGRKWYERRKIITPTFHFKILEQFVEIFDKLGNTVITNILNKYGPNDEVEFYPIMVLYALDVMCGMNRIILFLFLIFFF